MTTKYVIVPVVDVNTMTGIPYYTDGVITHTVQFYEEWAYPNKSTQDNPETPWKWKNLESNIPPVILDADGNVVI